jgi:hypothetical protein
VRAAILCCCLLAAPASAQQIRGRVVESGSGSPVRDATITGEALASPRSVNVVTDSAGRFALPLPFSGVWRLRIEHIAYAAVAADSIAVAPGEQLEVEVTLAPDVIPLEPIVVRSRERARLGRLREFYDRVERGGGGGNGTFITREDFEQYPGMQLSSHLAMVPGVTIVPVGGNNVVTMRGGGGRCRPAMYLDGVEVGDDFATMVDHLAHPETLEGVEVYRSGVFAPAMYGQHGCGVVLLWTRSGEGGRPFTWKRLLIGVGGFLGLVLLLRGV